MPGGPWSDQQNDLLSGLFGVFQQAAESHLDTSTIWSNLRTTAASFFYSSTGQPTPDNASEVEAQGRAILSSQGVSAANVSTYRMVAGQWLAAKQNLSVTAMDSQIQGNAIFTPPWATTTSNLVPSRYRLRMNATWTNQAGEAITDWKTYELFGPLTTPGAAIDSATSSLIGSGKYNVAGLVGVNDYEIEQI